MKSETQKINCILFNCILGLSELLWLFTTQQPYSELIFILIFSGLVFTFSTLTIVGLPERVYPFYSRIGFGFLLYTVAFMLLL